MFPQLLNRSRDCTECKIISSEKKLSFRLGEGGWRVCFVAICFSYNCLCNFQLFFSGFFWLLSLLLSSLLWFAVVPLRDQLVFGMVFSVIFQEMFRFLFYKLLRLVIQNVRAILKSCMVTLHVILL